MSARVRKLPDAEPPFNRPLWRTLQDRGGALGADFSFVTGSAEAQYGPTNEEPVTGEAELIETPFEIRALEGPAPSGFTHFLDGIERSCIVGYIGVVPIVYGYVAAVVRERKGGEFGTLAVREREGFYFPFAHLAPERWTEAGLPGDALHDSEASESDAHPVRLAERGRAAVKRQRERLEAEVAGEWARAGAPGWLWIDGPAHISPDVMASGRAVGVIKSHRTHFLSAEQMRRVLVMEAARRSSVFRPARPPVGEVHSWYVRLRSRVQRDLHFGLVRVEAAARPETAGLADEISRWLLGETAPLALPDPRWDTVLYPIRDCEQYLRARMPTLWPDEL